MLPWERSRRWFLLAEVDRRHAVERVNMLSRDCYGSINDGRPHRMSSRSFIVGALEVWDYGLT